MATVAAGNLGQASLQGIIVSLQMLLDPRRPTFMLTSGSGEVSGSLSQRCCHNPLLLISRVSVLQPGCGSVSGALCFVDLSVCCRATCSARQQSAGEAHRFYSTGGGKSNESGRDTFGSRQKRRRGLGKNKSNQ